ncbi:hypothetical protein AGRO_0751 [Agrobacterium sp. ATCC 31749]|uniref:class I SAM-dependent methyltransferase n=1 Tax=unclassified Agrobacterium TaxID=2632611 RepID=UPI00020DBB1F|nr:MULTISPECIES: class I SAM-dependent methyltransferase [unclassified Agrobacterium]EGL66506.1 hypothetical protein AGRO_0751 [Agrobacterium sp. ATCC 31749]QKW97308.1 hypothetical protein GSF67_09520 [Agrobacterium sp. CGMCC 11546]
MVVPSLVELAHARAPSRDQISKPDHYYESYERFFGSLREKPLSFFEIGVYRGESTKVFAEYFSRANIVGVDFDLHNIDLTGFDNITLYQGDQSDAPFLTDLVERHAASGVDIIIDDASHEGCLSLATFGILFPLLKSGGLYAIEDWGTGYWSDRPDGQAYKPLDVVGDRLVSHDYGMVGFVKSLVDHVAGWDTRSSFDFSEIASMHVLPGIVILQKA